MSQKYNEYLTEHCANVQKAGLWIVEHCKNTDILKGLNEVKLKNQLLNHDRSKYLYSEYNAYDVYFYGDNRTDSVISEFNYAWLHHIHKNPHHWQYWVLIHDDEPEEALEMPVEYVVEMIADWWSFSWKTGDLFEIFGWYDKHRSMILHPKTRELVEAILNHIKEELEKGA
jgi:hypothetical protein